MWWITIQIPKENMQAFLSEFSQQDNEEKVRFERMGWCITALVTLLSAIIAYFFSGKALKPLKDFAQQTEQINEESLTDTRLPEDTTAEFRQLSESVNGMLDRLAQAFDAQRQFTGNAAHELRTPLTVLRSGVEILEDFTRDAEGMSPARKGAILSTLERMQRTGRDMAETLGTMLLLARRPAHLELRDLDMDELMAAQMDFWRPVAERKGLELVFVRTAGEDAVSAVGNAELAAMIVKNLLENAVRYTESGYVRVELEESGLCVRNSAPPLDEEARRRIFERGERGTSGASSGSGLGLSLALRACKHMGWRITCESDAEGNAFRVGFGRRV